VALFALIACTATALLPATAQAQAPVACTHVVEGAFPEGFDHDIQAGETVCIRGTVTGSIWIVPANVTLTSAPGQTGTIRGQVIVGEDATGSTVSDLNLNSAGLIKPSPIILGDDVTVARNDITNERTPILCMSIGQLGHDTGAKAERVRIVGNKIHGCGTSDNHRHGLYVEHADGTQIIGNEIYDNADRGIQLYPSAQRSLVAGNIIDGNGQGIIFGGTGGSASSDNVVRNNVITNQRLRAGVESWWEDGTRPGTGNVVTDNCVYGDRLVDTGNGGFTESNNVEVDPLYVDRDAHDFRLRDGSPCAAILAAGRSGTTARLAVSRTSAGVPVTASKPLKVAVKRTRGTLKVTVRLAKTPAARSFARVEIRRSGGRWKSIGVRAISARRSITFKAKVPANRKITVRATLLRSQTKTFRR
jgi:nitrous oxidase accessory protein NosD